MSVRTCEKGRASRPGLNVAVPVVDAFLCIPSNALALVRKIATGVRRACLVEMAAVKFHDGKITRHIVFAVPAGTATGDQAGETQYRATRRRIVIRARRRRRNRCSGDD